MSLKRDTLYNICGAGLPLLAAVVTIPFLMSTLGDARFGTLTLIWALIGYFGVFDLGIGRAMTYEVSRYTDLDRHGYLRVVQSGLVLTLATGLIGFVCIYFFVAANAGGLFKVAGTVAQEIELAFKVAAIGIIPTTLNSGVRGGLEGFGRFGVSNVNRFLLGSAMFIFPAICCITGWGNLPAITWSLVGARLAVCVLGIYYLRLHIFGPLLASVSQIRKLLSYGVWVTVSGIVSPLMAYGDRFFVSAVVGVQGVSLYAIPQEGLSRLLIIPAALASALMPRMTVSESAVALRESYWQNLKRLAVVMLLVCAFAAAIARPALEIWMSAEFARNAIDLVYVLCIGLWFNAIAQLPITLLHAVGKPKTVALLHVIELMLFVVLIISLTKLFGVFGAAVAWSVRVALDFGLLHLLAMKAMEK